MSYATPIAESIRTGAAPWTGGGRNPGMGFIQTPPQLGNQYRDDRVLRGYLARTLPADMLREIDGDLDALGELSGGELYAMQRADRLNEPVLTAWDPWGNRVDHIEVTPLWKRAEALTAQYGLSRSPTSAATARSPAWTSSPACTSSTPRPTSTPAPSR